ncbi:MAG: ABC transporter substrate-binding protein [Cucumibacter sp.]
MKIRSLAGLAASAFAAALAGPALAFEGKSVAATDCSYGGTILSIEATDPLTVVFTMCTPDPAFLGKAAFTPFGIQPEEHILSAGVDGSIIANPIGTGPFKLDAWNRGDSIVYSRFEDYWGPKPAFQTLVYRWGDSGAARLTELRAGTVDHITALSPDDYSTVESDASLKFLVNNNPNVLYVGINHNNAPFDNIKVRHAIAMGIDRNRIVAAYYPAGSTVASHFTPCSLPNACVGEPWYDFDPAAAKALLAEAGYPDGFSTKIFFRDVARVYIPEPALIAVEIQSQLRDNLGINAEVVVMESGEFIAETTAGNVDGLFLLGWGADYPHVTNFLDFHFGTSSLRFGDPFPEIYEPLAEAATIGDAATAEPLYVTANNAIRDLVPMVPIANTAAAHAALATLEGANIPPFGAPQFEGTNPGKDTLVFMQNAEPISLYCGDETDGESLAACQPVVESLLNYAIDSGDTVPSLATSCESNADSTVWTCHLRDGVTFHDGSTFDADDVVVSWAAGIDASNPAHHGNTGSFEYFAGLWGAHMNAPAAE